MSAEQLRTLLADTVSESTLRKRIPMLLSLGQTFESNDLSWVSDANAIKKELLKKPVGTRCNYMRTIIGLAKALKLPKSIIDKYDNWANQWDTERLNARMQNQATDAHNEYLAIGLDGLRDRLNAFEPKSLSETQQKAILACYLYMPALRNDFGELHLVSKGIRELDSTKNYFYIRGKQLRIILNKYKTAQQYGRQDLKIEDQRLIDILKGWILRAKAFAHLKGQPDPEYLFYYRFNQKNGLAHLSPISLQTAIPEMSKKILGVSMSINDFRKLWETSIQLDPEYQKLSTAEQEKIHMKMLHSGNAARLDYRKI